MEVSGQLHTPAALHPGKVPLVPRPCKQTNRNKPEEGKNFHFKLAESLKVANIKVF
jgi:hypothetical protein